jgi:hypothetical protein
VDEICRSCSTHGRDARCYNVWLENQKRRDHLEDLGVVSNVILEWILGEIGWQSVELIHLAQDKDQWQAVLNTVIDLRVL